MERKIRRQKRVRAKLSGTSLKPRLTVFRSNKFIFAQIIDDEKGETLIGVSEKELNLKDKKNKTETAKEVGLLLAKKSKTKKINSVIFDRGPYIYHGRVKALADGAREGGLKF